MQIPTYVHNGYTPHRRAITPIPVPIPFPINNGQNDLCEIENLMHPALILEL